MGYVGDLIRKYPRPYSKQKKGDYRASVQGFKFIDSINVSKLVSSRGIEGDVW